MMTNHTSAPWIAATAISSVVGLPVVSQTGRLICNVNCVALGQHDQKVAGDDAFNREALDNAQLIGAAPDMRAALDAFPNRESESDADYLSRVGEWWIRKGYRAMIKAGGAA